MDVRCLVLRYLVVAEQQILAPSIFLTLLLKVLERLKCTKQVERVLQLGGLGLR